MREKTKEIRTIYHIDGNLCGKLWMPCETIDFACHETFFKQTENPFQLEFNNLYSALLQVQNNHSDFQSISFTETIQLTIVKEFGYYNEFGYISESKKIVKHLEITKENKEYSILFQ